ncbi:hypothetical protein BAUCODRAFT_315193 [Baudoinia panamericana UAMH 10762]|uniref:Uncharacterized protein n=1 Tax=Baudoinia panamericana (strain UAMH 10762) TaxID=717646 RepID=M2MXW7_BAUPA|nr:uncharacterized protein BAUCODRAFT_315193 [Baudoinia panamericana UAMH 10762]EMC91110.1 hypothetical protein BAUCODRAFT_315193 [Baudoinia panamericana UAMH 10762]
MARYPAFDDYKQSGNYQAGIQRCDALLQRKPKDVQLLTTKLSLLYAIRSHEAQRVLEQLLAIQPPIQGQQELIAIEDAVTDSQRHVFPQPWTAGPSVAKLWENAVKATPSATQRFDTGSLRFERAVMDNRIQDAQQALIQLKVIQPKNRVVYMAHAAFTQLLSTSNEDLQARLAIGLARKAVTEKLDNDQSLDCRVPGQVFALQRSEKDLESISGRRFRDSKQVFDAHRSRPQNSTHGIEKPVAVIDPSVVPAKEWLAAEVSMLKQNFTSIIQSHCSTDVLRSFATNAMSLFRCSIGPLSQGARRLPADACFLGVSALVRLWEQTDLTEHLLRASFLLERLLVYDEHIHEARLVLTYLYMRLGLGSLAMKYFTSLRVKGIQQETVGHVIYTRLSLVHPHDSRWNSEGAEAERAHMDPVAQLLRAQADYVDEEESIAGIEANILSHGQTGMIFDLQELRDHLRSSMTRRIMTLERRRCCRMQQVKITDVDTIQQMGPRTCQNWIKTVDMRDFAAAFDYGYNVERALHARGGTLPGTAWLLYGLAADAAWCLGVDAPPLVQDAEQLLSVIEALKKSISVEDVPSTESAASRFGLTSAEFLAGEAACRALTVALMLHSMNMTEFDGDHLANAVESVRAAVEAINVEMMLSTPDQVTDRLFDCYTAADACYAVFSACDVRNNDRISGPVMTSLRSLRDHVKQLLASLHGHAKQQQTLIFPDVVVDRFQGDAQMSLALQGFGGIGEFCKGVAASAREGWEGIC